MVKIKFELQLQGQRPKQLKATEIQSCFTSIQAFDKAFTLISLANLLHKVTEKY